MTTISEALNALDNVKRVINLAYETGYSAGIQKRKWVSLTDKDIMKIDATYYRPMGPLEFSKLLDAKLKEKNNG